MAVVHNPISDLLRRVLWGLWVFTGSTIVISKPDNLMKLYQIIADISMFLSTSTCTASAQSVAINVLKVKRSIFDQLIHHKVNPLKVGLSL